MFFPIFLPTHTTIIVNNVKIELLENVVNIITAETCNAYDKVKCICSKTNQIVRKVKYKVCELMSRNTFYVSRQTKNK
jgi:hypothetical protein